MARQRATAVGFSSSRPLLGDGMEDPVRSRRVVLSVAFSRNIRSLSALPQAPVPEANVPVLRICPTGNKIFDRIVFGRLELSIATVQCQTSRAALVNGSSPELFFYLPI